MLTCIVIDDEPLACDILEQYISKSGTVKLKAVFNSAVPALDFLATNAIDIIFLDIEMPEMSGIDLLKKLDNPPVTVFTTAYRDYAYEGYELGVIDFLLKPVSFERFLQAIQKARDFFSLKDQHTSIENDDGQLGSVFVKSGVQKIKLNFDDVTHIQGLKDYAIIHHAGGKVVIKGSVKSMHDIFPEKHFMRVHKSFIVAKHKIVRIERNKIMLKNFQVPVGRIYKEALENFLKKNN
ncbi:MAG: LytTR family DNA-binding domain-containing protein [Agriterribacter sp.]